jgi:hypothetical protein
MRINCLRKGLLMAGFCAVFPLKEAAAGPAKEEPRQAVPKTGSDGKTVVVKTKQNAHPVVSLSARPDSVGGGKASKKEAVEKNAIPPKTGMLSTGTQKLAVEQQRTVKPQGPVTLPKLEAFQTQAERGKERGRELQAKKETEVDVLKWTRFATGRDDYFPEMRLLGCNAPLVRQVSEMRLAMDVGYPRRPPKLPRIVFELPRTGVPVPTSASDSKGVSGPDSEAAIEFFSEPATRAVGGSVGIESVVIPIFRVAQPPPIPPVQSRANLRQE